jgi:hypothetical protein
MRPGLGAGRQQQKRETHARREVVAVKQPENVLW